MGVGRVVGRVGLDRVDACKCSLPVVSKASRLSPCFSKATTVSSRRWGKSHQEVPPELIHENSRLCQVAHVQCGKGGKANHLITLQTESSFVWHHGELLVWPRGVLQCQDHPHSAVSNPCNQKQRVPPC